MPVWDLESVEQAFAEAALDPSRWVKALDRLAAITGSHGALLIPTTGCTFPVVPCTERLTRSLETYVEDGWHARNVRLRGIPRMLRRGVVDDLDILSPDAMARHPYYQEFLAPHRLRWFAGIGAVCLDELWCLSIQRTIDQDPFSEAEKDQLADLSRRLSTSVAITRALGASAAAGALDAFEVSGAAVLLINRHGNVFEANRSARTLLVGDVRIEKARLVAGDARATADLNRAIHDLLRRPLGGLAAPVPLPRKGRRPLLAYPARVSSMAANSLANCQALVVLVDPDLGRQAPEAALRSAFGLSDAEARLAAQLASGAPLETAAERIGIAKETSRSQLKSIFAKTGVHRQAELVALLARLP